MLSANEGSVRRALSEPSIGSMTTRFGDEPSPKTTSPRSSEIAVNCAPAACRRSSSPKTISSASRSITSERSPPSPTPAYSVRALIPRVRGEELGLRGDHPPAGVEPGVGGQSRDAPIRPSRPC